MTPSEESCWDEVRQGGKCPARAQHRLKAQEVLVVALLEEETNDRPPWGRVVVGPLQKPGGRDLSRAGQVRARCTSGSPRLEPPGSGLPLVRSSL